MLTLDSMQYVYCTVHTQYVQFPSTLIAMLEIKYHEKHWNYELQMRLGYFLGPPSFHGGIFFHFSPENIKMIKILLFWWPFGPLFATPLLPNRQ